MTERRAIALIMIVGLLFECVAIVGLTALHANSSTVGLGFLIPLIVCPYLVSSATMRYGSGRDRRG